MRPVYCAAAGQLYPPLEGRNRRGSTTFPTTAVRLAHPPARTTRSKQRQRSPRRLASDEFGSRKDRQGSDHGLRAHGLTQRPVGDGDRTDRNQIVISAYRGGRQGLERPTPQKEDVGGRQPEEEHGTPDTPGNIHGRRRLSPSQRTARYKGLCSIRNGEQPQSSPVKTGRHCRKKQEAKDNTSACDGLKGQGAVLKQVFHGRRD